MYVIKGQVVNGCVEDNGDIVEYICGPGVATFAKKGQIHWTRNPFDEPAEFVFSYYGTANLHESGYVDNKADVPVPNVVPQGQGDQAQAIALHHGKAPASGRLPVSRAASQLGRTGLVPLSNFRHSHQ